jgi:hypothetical protein
MQPSTTLILSDLHAIQNLYRDRTMHLRKGYDGREAQSAMFLGKVKIWRVLTLSS